MRGKNKEGVFNLVKEILIEQGSEALGSGGIKEDSRYDTLGMDSLDDVELVMVLEEEFDVEISFEDAEEYGSKTIGEIAEAILDMDGV